MKVEKSIEIATLPERIWPFMAEPQKILEWYIPLQKFEYTIDQRNEVSAPFYFEEKTTGGIMKLNCVITEWVPNERFAFKMTSGNLMKSYGEEWTVETIPSGSRFTFTEQGELPYGVIGKIMGSFAQRSSGKIIEKMLTKLKNLAET